MLSQAIPGNNNWVDTWAHSSRNRVRLPEAGKVKSRLKALRMRRSALTRSHLILPNLLIKDWSVPVGKRSKRKGRIATFRGRMAIIQGHTRA